MSVINAGWGTGPESNGMPSGIAFSAALHLIVLALVLFGMPVLFHPRVAENPPIAVTLVKPEALTRATHPNREIPHRHALLEKPIPGPPVSKPQAKPAPPKPAPPPSAAAPKPQPVPRATPKPVVKRVEAPPKPKPVVKTVETPPKPKPVVKTVETPPKPKPVAKTVETPPKPKPVAKVAEKTVIPPPPVPEAKPAPPPNPLAAVVPPPLPKVKPAPPLQRVRTRPKPKPKKYDAAMFASLLKNLASNQSASSENGRPQRRSTPAGRASSQPKAPRGATLSASEIALIREQIARCWNIPAGARGAKDLVIDIAVSLNPDGTVRTAEIRDQARLATDPVFRSAAESARRALFDPRCTPLHLPPNRYSVWKNLDLSFTPKDIL